MKRNFDKWLSCLKDNIASWDYYVDFNKVYQNIDEIKVELNILNSLVGSKNIEHDFKKLIIDYPKTLKVIPLLLAKRDKEVRIIDGLNKYNFHFEKMNYNIDKYTEFMSKSGLFGLLENRIINSLVDYSTGVEVGMDTNGRKNRTGITMESIVESYLIQSGLIKDIDFFKQMRKSSIEDKLGIRFTSIKNLTTAEKKFDFVVIRNSFVYAIETNFFSGGGSKLNETARSYKNLALEASNIKNFKFIWITDGVGWLTAKNNLKETFEIMDTLYSLHDLENGQFTNLFTIPNK